MILTHLFRSEREDDNDWGDGPFARDAHEHLSAAAWGQCIQSANARLKTLVLSDESEAQNEYRLGIAWAKDVGAPYCFTVRTGVFHIWQDCGKTAESIMGIAAIDKNTVAALRADGGTQQLTHTGDREKFIRAGLGAQADLGADAEPDVGEAFLRVFPASVNVNSGYRYHWGTVIMKYNHAIKARRAVVTLENGAYSAANQVTCQPSVHVYGVTADNQYGLPTFSIWLGDDAKTVVVKPKVEQEFQSMLPPPGYTSKKAVASALGAYECMVCDAKMSRYSYTSQVPQGNSGKMRKKMSYGLE